MARLVGFFFFLRERACAGEGLKPERDAKSMKRENALWAPPPLSSDSEDTIKATWFEGKLRSSLSRSQRQADEDILFYRESSTGTLEKCGLIVRKL
jgi:hypothetical protein